MPPRDVNNGGVVLTVKLEFAIMIHSFTYLLPKIQMNASINSTQAIHHS